MGLTRPRAEQIYNLDYKQATRVITVANITLAGGAPNQVDGVNLSVNDRVLVTGQDNPVENGIYFVDVLGTGSSGTWLRSSDTNSTGELDAGTIVMVTEGNLYKDTQWKLTTDDPIIIGVTPLNWAINILSTVGGANTQVQFNSSGLLGGSANFTFDGSNVSVAGNISSNYILGNGSQLTGLPATYSNSNVQTYLPTYSGNIGALTVTGNLSVTGTTTTGLIGSNIVPASNVTYSLGNATNRWSNIWLSNSTIYLGNVAISATDTGITVDGANVLTGNAGSAFSTSGNVTGGNVLTGGYVSATGNITGSYIIGNGSQLTGLPAGYSNVNATSFLANFGSNTISTTGNITAGYFIGNGSSLTSLTGANVTGTVANATYAATAVTVTNAAQPNITSVGTLTSLSSSGNITGANINGNGSGLSSLTGANVTGTVANATYATSSGTASSATTAGTVTTNAQPNINSVGTLTSLSSSGNITGSYLIGNGSQLTSVTGANVTGTVANTTYATSSGTASSATTAGTVTTNAQPNITSVGTLTSLSSSGNITGGNVNTGGNVAGNWVLPTTGVSTGGNVLVGGYISVVGNLYVSNVVSSGNLVVTDPLVYFTNTQSYPYNYDIGFYSAFTGNPGNTYQHTGLVRDYVDNTWKLFSNVPEPTSTSLDFTNAIYDPLKMGALTATTGAFSSTVSATANVTGGNILTGGSVSATGNITGSNLVISGSGGALSGTGNISAGNFLTGGIVSATGNITGSYIIGNGSQLTGLPAGYTNANLATLGSNVISTTGTITSGNITGSNVLTAGLMSSTGNATHGNILTGGVVSATGNITGNYVLGNAAFMTGIPASYGNSNVATLLAGFGSNTISTTGTITSGNITSGNILTGGIVSATGTITGGNIATGGSGGALSGTGNITAGNFLTGGIVSATGNITSGNISATNHTGTTVSVTGNVTGASLVGGVISGTSASLIGNITANAITGASVSVTGAVTGASLVGTITTASQPNITTVGTLSSLTVTNTIGGGNLSTSGTLTVNSNNAVTAIINAGTNGTGNIGASGATFNTIFAKATTAQYADLAEMYVADQDYPAGTVVEFGGKFEITASTQTHSTRVAGVVSTNPSYLMNSAQEGTDVLPVALTGRVPCRVVGTIRKGDRLVASPFSGVAMALDNRLYEPGCIIGKALEAYDSIADGVIEVAVGRF